MDRLSGILAVVIGALLGLAALSLVAFRKSWIPSIPLVMAALVILASMALLIEAATIFRAWKAGLRRPVRAVSGLCLTVGLLIVCAAGLFNWLLSLQGAVILNEGESVILSHTAQLQEFEAGLLSNLDEMRVSLTLTQVDLVARDGGFVPESRLSVGQGHAEPVTCTVTPFQSERLGTLWFHQGAFGFSPRIVLQQAGETVFDRSVPFVTRRQGSQGTSFSGSFDLEKENLSVDGEISLVTLDERMRGHATAILRLSQGERILGEGELKPGHFADLEGGYRVGFAGLTKWSEINVSRRNYVEPMLAGAALSVIGALVWPLARWRRW